MSRSRSARAALSRVSVLVTVVVGALVVMAGTSLAAPVGAVDATTSTVSAGPAVAGVSVGTFTWALVGFLVLALGFIAASRSGRAPGRSRLAATGPRSYQPSAFEAQGESKSRVAV